MRKVAGFVMAFVLMAMLVGCGKDTELSEHFDETEILKQAENVVNIANEGSFDNYQELWEESLRSKIDEQSFDEQVLPVIKEKGAFESIGKKVVIGQKDEKTGMDYAVAILIGEYSNGKIQYTISFDEDLNMIGFFLK